VKTVVKLYELKIGQKFYYQGMIYILEDYRFDLKYPDSWEFYAKQFKWNKHLHIAVHGHDVLNTTLFYRYVRRDVHSFVNGFKLAMEISTQHMSKRGKKKAGIDDPLKMHMKMMQEYNKWKQNTVDWDGNYGF